MFSKPCTYDTSTEQVLMKGRNLFGTSLKPVYNKLKPVYNKLKPVENKFETCSEQV